VIDNEKRAGRVQQKEKVRRRMQVKVDPNKYRYIPAKKQIDYYDNDVNQRVAIYVRVSTDDVRQTTSYELQKKYYEDFITHHPNWTLTKIYADEGISGTSLKHRDAFNEMIADCKADKIDMIITKSVSRFARNVEDFIGTVRQLAEQRPRVGVFFESENIFSLNDDSQMALTFQATMAEEESHTRSRSMETSLRMRLDNGLPLTPELLGYSHDAEGQLVINPDEAPTVKLAFYMYLYGYSTQQIADEFIAQARRSYLGNTTKWTSNSIVQILRNERHCGDVLTRKTFTENYRNHRTLKNRGEKPQSLYYDHHEAIVSRDDFIAVQRLLDNAKYGNKMLPELRVIDSGFLKGFVIINPTWANFTADDYYSASMSIFHHGSSNVNETASASVELTPGSLDLREFEIARSELFDATNRPFVSFGNKRVKFSSTCVRKFKDYKYIEMLINPVDRRFAIRPAIDGSRSKVQFYRTENGKPYPREIAASAFLDTLYDLFGWTKDRKYRILGSLYEQGNEMAYIFDAENSQAFFSSQTLIDQQIASQEAAEIQPLTVLGKHVRAIREEWTTGFGTPFYLHERSASEIANQSEQDWKLFITGKLYETGKKLDVTPYSTLKSYIQQELQTTTQ